MKEKLKIFAEKDFVKSVIAFLLIVSVALVALKYFDIEILKSWVEKFGLWGVLVFISAKALALIVAPINGTPVYILGALSYGPFLGFVYSFIGDMIGAVVSFWLARKIGRVWVDKLFSNKEEGMISRLLNMFATPKGVFLGHIFFVTFPDILNYAAGLSRVTFRTYMLIHAPFTAAVILVVSYGSGLVFMLGTKGIAIVSVLGLLAIAVGIWLMNMYSKRFGIDDPKNNLPS
jgi:uncharacterized membrane protein YdjX (TVP38/TMEM64 family)